MSEDIQENLMETIDRFRDRHAMSASEFGVLSVNSSNLLPTVAAGRKLGAATIAKIVHWMRAYDEEQRAADLAALELVRRCGFIIVESDGLPRLETETQISPKAFARLTSDGLLVPSGDAMFGCTSQTYRPAEVANAA